MLNAPQKNQQKKVDLGGSEKMLKNFRSRASVDVKLKQYYGIIKPGSP